MSSKYNQLFGNQELKEKPDKPTYKDAVHLLLETCQILTRKVDELELKVAKLVANINNSINNEESK